LSQADFSAASKDHRAFSTLFISSCHCFFVNSKFISALNKDALVIRGIFTFTV
jgi:hypothetical protein